MPQKLVVQPEDVQSLKVNPGDVSDVSEGNPPGVPGSQYPEIIQGLLGLGCGAAKQAAKISYTPQRLVGEVTKRMGLTNLPKAFQGVPPEKEAAMQQQGPWEQAGGTGLEALSFLAPGPAELEGANLVQKGLRSAVPYLRRMGAGSMLQRPILGAANIAGRGAIGAGTNAAVAYANEEDPALAAKVGGAIPAGVTAAKPALTWLGNKAKEWAVNAMARAIEPGSRVDKWTAMKVIGPLLEQGRVWWTSKGLKNIAEDEINAAAAKKSAARAQLGTNPQMLYDDVEQALREGKDKAFYSGRSAQGVPMANIPAESRAGAEFTKFIDDYLQPKVGADPNTGARTIPFDELDLTKRKAQDYAASHGKAFLDLPRDPATSAEADVLKEVSNAVRPQLEDFAGQDWADANKQLHANIAIKELAEERMGKKLGQKVPLAERMVGGYGWHMGGATPTAGNELPGMLTRLYRRLVDSPGWSSTTAQMKDWLANRLLNSSGVYAGGIGSDIASQKNPEFRPGDNPSLQIQSPTTQEYIWTAPGQIKPKQ